MRLPRLQAESTGSFSYAYRNSTNAFFPRCNSESRSVLKPCFLATASIPGLSLRYSLWNFLNESFVRRFKFLNNSSASCPSGYTFCSNAKRHFKYVSKAKAAIVTSASGRIRTLPLNLSRSNTCTHCSKASADRKARWGSKVPFFAFFGGQSLRQIKARNQRSGLRTALTMPARVLPFFFLSSFVFPFASLKFCFGNGKNLPHGFAEII